MGTGVLYRGKLASPGTEAVGPPSFAKFCLSWKSLGFPVSRTQWNFIYFPWVAVGISEEKCQTRERGQEVPGTACNVARETKNEETMKCREALKGRWSILRTLFKNDCLFLVRGIWYLFLRHFKGLGW